METEFNICANLRGHEGMRNMLIIPLKRSYIVMLDGKELCIVWKNKNSTWHELNEKLGTEVTEPIGKEIDNFLSKQIQHLQFQHS